MEAVSLSGLSPLILIAIGIALIALESIFFSFVLFWVGLATIVVGAYSYFDSTLDLKWQLSLIAILSLLLLILLRAKAVELFLKSKDAKQNDNFLNESGYGIIKNSKVFYKATYWDINPEDEHNYVEGDKVFVQKVKKNIAYLKENSKL